MEQTPQHGKDIAKDIGKDAGQEGGKDSGNAVGKDSSEAVQAAGADARERLMEDLKNIIGEAETWLGNAKVQVAEDSADIRARFEDTLRTARTDLLKLEDSFLARGRLAAQATDDFVRDNPWKGVLLGATIGLLVGVLIVRNEE
jgi:ElaB/YqjD/DUF883 family membrane-anchored ribosome-binding protein